MDVVGAAAPRGPVDGFGQELAEWREVAELLRAAAPATELDVWLGRVVYEALQAGNLVKEWATCMADAIVEDALREAENLRSRRSIVSDSIPDEEDSGFRQRSIIAVPFRPPPLPGISIAGPAYSGSSQPASVMVEMSPAAPHPTLLARPPTQDQSVRTTEGERLAEPTTRGMASQTPVARQGFSAIVRVAAAVAIVAVGMILFENAGTARIEHAAQRRLTARLAHGLSMGATDTSGVLGFLTVPRMNLDRTVVVQDATLADLRSGPASERSSVRPGAIGTVVIIGHRRTYGAPFAELNRLTVGDLITLRTDAGTFTYSVSRNPVEIHWGPGATIPLPSPGEVASSGGKSDLAARSLILATSVGWTGGHLQVVIATLSTSSGVAVDPSSGPGTTMTSLYTVAGQEASLLLFGFWLVLGGLALYFAPRSWPRLPRGSVYALASVVALLAVYQAFLAVDRALPGSF